MYCFYEIIFLVVVEWQIVLSTTPSHRSAVVVEMWNLPVVLNFSLILWSVDLGFGQLELCKNFVTTLDYDTLTVGSKKLVYFAQEKSFDEALVACEKIGMRLATIESQEENKAIFQFLHNRVWGVNGPSYDYTYWYMWCSAKQEKDAGYFTWKSTGKNVTYTSWGEGEPNGGKGESCVELRYITGDTLFWNDSLCFIKKRYICESTQKNVLSLE